MTKVLIGIQARSGSTRLPNKSTALILGKRMLDRVIDSCKRAAHLIKEEQKNRPNKIFCQIAVLTPIGDPISMEFGIPERCHIIEGSRDDVLSRYVNAAKELEADYIVRITGDCPLIPHYIINRHINLAVLKGYDYISNVHEKFRTSIDGTDCEVISKKLLAYLDECAKDASDREHVTTYARKFKPAWAKYGHVINYFDQSDIKLSVDTPEDLERVIAEFDRVERKHQLASFEYGSTAVHRL